MSEPTGARRYGVGGGDAYYDAVKYGGYEGTREQFGRDQAEFAQNAAAVAEAKEAVEQDAEEVRSTKEEFVNTTVPDAIDAVQQEGADQVEAVTEKGEEVSQQVEAVGTEQKDAVANEGRARVRAVEQAGTDQVQAVNDAGTTQVGNVNQAGEDQVDAVEQAGADQVQAVTDEGTTQVGNVTGEGNTQVQRVQDKGDEVLNSIPSDYTELTEDVDNLKESLYEEVKLPVPVGTADRYIIWDEGTQTSATSLSTTGYVDVGDYDAIRFKRYKSTAQTTRSGMSFYDSNMTWCAGLQFLRQSPSIGYEWCVYPVPSNAKYARFTKWTDTTTYGDFEVYGIKYDSFNGNVTEPLSLISVTDDVNLTQSGITVTKVSDNAFSVVGTQSDGDFSTAFDILNGNNHAGRTTTILLSANIPKGTYTLVHDAPYGTAFRKLEYNANYNTSIILGNGNTFEVTGDNGGELFFVVAVGTTFTEAITVHFALYKGTTKIPITTEKYTANDYVARSLASGLNVKSHVNVADMKADIFLKVGDVCITNGYYTANDGGHGVYKIRQNNSDTSNNGSIHILTNGLVAELIPEKNNVLNIKQWGAVSDGVTDISTVYGKCIDYIKANFPVTYIDGDNGYGGGTIFFPAGNYFVANQLEARHYVAIVGENKYTTRITGTPNRIFFAQRDDYTGDDAIGRMNNFILKNITFYNCTSALRLIQCIGTIIEDCQFINCSASALYLALTVNVTIRNCLFRKCGTGIYFPTVGTGPSTTVLIDRCWFRRCTTTCITINCGDNKCGIQPCSIKDSIFEYNVKALTIIGSETYPTLVNFVRCFFEGNTNTSTIENASVVADMENFFAPVGAGVTVTPAAYNKTQISNLSDTIGFTVT